MSAQRRSATAADGARLEVSAIASPELPVQAWIGLGSNMGERAENLRNALAALRATPRIQRVTASPLYETEPVGPPQARYLNAAAGLETTLSPIALLETLLAIERSAGRERGPGQTRWGPRVLDLDLLLYASRIVDAPGLSVPHPRLHERAFVLVPLLELAPGLAHPTLGPLAPLALALEDRDDVRRWAPEGSGER